MLRKRSILISVCLILLIGVFSAASFGGHEDQNSSAAAADAGQSDLVSLLRNTVSGDTINLKEDTVLSGDVNIKPGVVLNDNGFSLRIPQYMTLSVEGIFNSSGNLTVDFGGALTVASGGLLSIDNGENAARIYGFLEVYGGGTLNVGSEASSTLECGGNGRILVAGTMAVGSASSHSVVNVRNAAVTGYLQIYSGSTFRVLNSLTVGSAPALTGSADTGAEVSGTITLESSGGNSAYVIVYERSVFSSSNIRYPSASTQFMILGKTYATEYKDRTGSRTIVLPSVSELKDFYLTDWKDSRGNVIDGSGVQIGSTGYTAIYGEVAKCNYIITLGSDRNIKWVVNGIVKGSSGEITDAAYDARYTIGITLAGAGELPTIYRDGIPYAGTSSVSFDVTGNTTFTTSNSYPGPRDDKVPMLLALLFAVVLMLAAALSALIKKNKKAEE